ncbi:MAG: hypothetical protein AAGA60_32450 [Cyanobacteria bacterium P01_E01_bin.42]
MKQWFVATATALTVCVLSVGQAKAATIFTDNFDAGASSLWGNETGDWTVTDGKYFANDGGNSSLPFLLSDFSVELDITNIQNNGIWLRSSLDAGTSLGRTGVLLAVGGLGGTGTGMYWHIVTDGNDSGPVLNEISGLFEPGITDEQIRIEVSGDTYSAFIGDSLTPLTTLTTNIFSSGQVALGDSGNFPDAFNSITIDVPDTSSVPEPSSAVLLALIGAGVVCRYRSRTQH